jgi:hypothetical protein
MPGVDGHPPAVESPESVPKATTWSASPRSPEGSTLLVASENGLGKRTGFDRLPQAIPRRQGHHHHEGHRTRPARRRRRHRHRTGRTHAHDLHRPEHPHPRQRNPRNRPRRPGRETPHPQGRERSSRTSRWSFRMARTRGRCHPSSGRGGYRCVPSRIPPWVVSVIPGWR